LAALAVAPAAVLVAATVAFAPMTVQAHHQGRPQGVRLALALILVRLGLQPR
jgi:hypothetical protein